MIKRSFFGLVKPKLQYEIIDEVQPEPVNVNASGKIMLYIDQPYENPANSLLKIGDQVKNGQKIAVSKDADTYMHRQTQQALTALERV